MNSLPFFPFLYQFGISCKTIKNEKAMPDSFKTASTLTQTNDCNSTELPLNVNDVKKLTI